MAKIAKSQNGNSNSVPAKENDQSLADSTDKGPQADKVAQVDKEAKAAIEEIDRVQCVIDKMNEVVEI